MSVIDEIADERKRQIDEKGFTPERDDFLYEKGELRLGAISYALRACPGGDTPIFSTIGTAPFQGKNAGHIGAGHLFWPWPNWKFPYHESARERLVKAAALLVAEIEQIDRRSTK